MKTFLVTGNFDGEIQDFFFFLEGARTCREGKRGRQNELIRQLRPKGEGIRLYVLHHLDDTHGARRASGE